MVEPPSMEELLFILRPVVLLLVLPLVQEQLLGVAGLVVSVNREKP
jgi:hypothetical protein